MFSDCEQMLTTEAQSDTEELHLLVVQSLDIDHSVPEELVIKMGREVDARMYDDIPAVRPFWRGVSRGRQACR